MKGVRPSVSPFFPPSDLLCLRSSRCKCNASAINYLLFFFFFFFLHIDLKLKFVNKSYSVDETPFQIRLFLETTHYLTLMGGRILKEYIVDVKMHALSIGEENSNTDPYVLITEWKYDCDILINKIITMGTREIYLFSVTDQWNT